jgi:ABC-2 type transport system permease protein
MTRRNLLRIIRTPQLLFMSVLQPSIILLLFRYVLGGAIRVPGARLRRLRRAWNLP